MAPIIERIAEDFLLGEAPHWDVDNQVLYFVDIFGKKIVKYNPATKKITQASVGSKPPSFIIPVAGKKNQFVISLGNELVIISWDGESEKITKVETLCASETTNSKFNDAKCDSTGRLWAGAHVLDPDLAKTQPLGHLYTYNAQRQLKSQLGKIRVANGLAFNDQIKKMYFIDSLDRSIDQFDFDIATGTLSKKQVLFSLEKFGIPGIPDGMAIDTEGNLWVAVFGGSRVLKIDGKKPETLLETIDMPAIQVTSMAFGGKNLDELYVTTGAIEFDGQKPSPPVHGATYRILNTGSKGFPGISFKLNYLGVGLGEGPHWDIATQSLYFLDCQGQYLVKYNPATKKVTKASTAPKQPTFIIPVQGKKDHFIISLDKELAIILWDGESDKFTIVEKLCSAADVPDKAKNFNDGKCDSSGRLWAGTLHINGEDVDKTLPVGVLYSFDPKRKLKAQVNQVRLTNGLAFNDKTKKAYYIDSLKGTVDRFDFDIDNGTVSNRQDWFTLKKHNIPGVPDGMTIDADGNLWVAVFGGNRVLKVDGEKPETLLDTIAMPALQVTSVAFGGPNLDELYVTSAALPVDGKIPPPPDNGATYKITDLGSKGLPASNFKLN